MFNFGVKSLLIDTPPKLCRGSRLVWKRRQGDRQRRPGRAHRLAQPWQSDVTEWIRPGANTIQVVVIGTLKNTLGPHHAGGRCGAFLHPGPSIAPLPPAHRPAKNTTPSATASSNRSFSGTPPDSPRSRSHASHRQDKKKPFFPCTEESHATDAKISRPEASKYLPPPG